VLASSSIGRYQVLNRLGSGGMATLYLARDPQLGREVAIKLLGDHFEPEFRERFLREAQAVAGLHHPNIVTIYDIGSHDGHPFIAMEYVNGSTLLDLLRRPDTLTLLEKLSIVRDVCRALHYAHGRDIVHRDVKPANVMIGLDGTTKLLDFGIARTPNSGMTRAGMIMGTPQYMSPEQIVGGDVDIQSSRTSSIGRSPETSPIDTRAPPTWSTRWIGWLHGWSRSASPADCSIPGRSRGCPSPSSPRVRSPTRR
jgi:serine/threonine-protein kinase